MTPKMKIASALSVVAIIVGFVLTRQPTPAVAASNAGWISSICYSHSLQEDPITNPGPAGTLSAHLHDFTGALTTDASSDAASLRAGGTCAAQQDDSAASWFPQATSSSKGLVHPQANQDKDVLVYYRCAAAVCANVIPFPDGFSMILGNAHATNPSENPDIGPHMWFKCGPGGGTHVNPPPTTCGSGHYVVAVYTFPQFWDGAYTPLANSITHMSYVRDNAHLISLPRIQIFERFSPLTGTVGTLDFASGPWYTAHADYVNSWQQAPFQALIARCINRNVDCGTNPAP
jgi:Domain of unknown function (DUF1996)